MSNSIRLNEDQSKVVAHFLSKNKGKKVTISQFDEPRTSKRVTMHYEGSTTTVDTNGEWETWTEAVTIPAEKISSGNLKDLR